MPRALWKGYLQLGEVSCPVSLYAAASTAERISFHTINRATGNRVRREYVDLETDEIVAREDQVKGYETGPEQYIVLEPEEIAAAVPESNKTLAVEAFVPCSEIDSTYFDKPYYLTPGDAASGEVFALVREGLRKKGTAAVARAVLFRKMRSVIVRAQGRGLVAHTLKFDYEVRAAEEAFEVIPDITVKADMLDLARHIIETKLGEFDPVSFTDRYDDALADLVRAKAEGRAIEAPAPAKAPQVVDLMEALRASAAGKAAAGKARTGAKAKAAGKGKAAAAAKSAPHKRAG